MWALASATQLVRTAGCHGLGVCALAWLPALVPPLRRRGALPNSTIATESVHPTKTMCLASTVHSTNTSCAGGETSDSRCSRRAQGLLASGSADTTVKLWRLPGGGGAALEAVQTLRGHTDAVHALAFVPARGWLASGGSDGSVRLWRVDAGGGLAGGGGGATGI